jgi:uncharacterized protein YndB with AHSA1/START domain
MSAESVEPSSERVEVSRLIPAPAAAIYALLTDPQGHVLIDSSGMLQSAEGSRVTAVGDTFVVHMDRESLGDLPMGKYDVTVIVTKLDPDALVEWTISGRTQPPIGHLYGYQMRAADGGTMVTSYYDWSQIEDRYRDRVNFPVVPPIALKATLGILARTVQQR